MEHVHHRSTDIADVPVMKWGGGQMSWKTALAILIFIGAAGVTAFWKYSDSHNKEIFLSKEEDREHWNQNQDSQRRLEKSLDEVKADQKQLINHLLRKQP